MNKYSIIISTLLVALITFSCRTSNLLPSRFEQGIIIDGSDKDWPTLTRVKVSSQTSYGVYNDYEHGLSFVQNLRQRHN